MGEGPALDYPVARRSPRWYLAGCARRPGNLALGCREVVPDRDVEALRRRGRLGPRAGVTGVGRRCPQLRPEDDPRPGRPVLGPAGRPAVRGGPAVLLRLLGGRGAAAP